MKEYFLSNGLNITRDINNRIESLKEDFEKMMFSKRFFIDVDVRNCILDLVYYRNLLQSHFFAARKFNITDEFLDTELYYHGLLKDIEQKGFMAIMQIKEPWFGYSTAQKDNMNKQILEIIKGI